jgi:acetyl-CoA acetyltransferase
MDVEASWATRRVMMQRDVAIVGVGLHPWGRFPQKSIPEMAVEAMVGALKDAKMRWHDIESMVSATYMWVTHYGGVHGTLSGTSTASLMGSRGIPIVNVVNACATGGSALREAYLTVASGVHDVVMAVASDKSAIGFFSPLSKDPQDIDYLRFVMVGQTNPAYWAIECRRRMHDNGTTDEDLALVKAVASRASVYNRNARYRKVFTKEEVLASPMVCDPLRLLEICATSDGAAAVILAPLDKATKYTDKPAVIDAAAVATDTFGDPTIRLTFLSSFPRPNVPRLSESRNALAAAYKQAGRDPDDIDVIELPDNSSWHYLAYLEGILGLEPGEAEEMLRKGETDPIKGKVPVCPSGGLGAFGEAVVAQGLAQVCELVWQLRGEAGDRQVRKDHLKVALAQTYGYAGNNAACIVSRAW